MEQKFRILVVEDEKAIAQGLVDLFVFHGYHVDVMTDGKTGLERAISTEYDLVVLDVMLPELDGFTVCTRIREKKREQLIVMLTAKTTEEDIITGLASGADDYIGKPFSVRELVLRVEAVLRRSVKAKQMDRQLIVGDGLQIDVKTLTAKDKKGIESIFTRREIEILQYLKANADRPVTRGELLEEVWGYKRASMIETRTVDIHIAKLRRKIEVDPKNPSYLITTRGEGYQLLESPLQK